MNLSSGDADPACPDPQDDHARALPLDSGRDRSSFGLRFAMLPYGDPRKQLVDMTGESLEYLDMMSDHPLDIDAHDPDHRDDG
ncbi:hypothetical protein ACFWFX_05205 [Streptomyces roseolus]|uniref:hypothetical protein n=1 Tax=Streptomyces roseolus TaxID=67358 RepID=UPI00364DDDE5